MPPSQKVSGVSAVIWDCGGVGYRWPEWWRLPCRHMKVGQYCWELSASTIQSALPAVSPWLASNRTR
jgi:hypothetical protein